MTDGSRCSAAAGFALLLLGGCDSTAPSSVAAESAASVKDRGAPPPAQRCDAARGRALEKEMLAVCEVGAQSVDDRVPVAPWKAQPMAPPRGTSQLLLSAEGVSFAGEAAVPFARFEARLGEQIERDTAMAAALGEPRPGFSLAVTGDVARAQVVQAFALLSASGRGHLVLASEDVSGVPSPRDPAVAKALVRETGEAGSSTSGLAVAAKKRLVGCPGVERTVEAVLGHTAIDEQCAVLARGLSEALISCECARADETLTVFRALALGVTPITRRAVALPVLLKPGASLPPGQTWAEIVAASSRATFAALDTAD